MLEISSIQYDMNPETLHQNLRVIIDFDAESLVEFIKDSGRDDAAYEIGDKLFLRIVKYIDRNV